MESSIVLRKGGVFSLRVPGQAGKRLYAKLSVLQRKAGGIAAYSGMRTPPGMSRCRVFSGRGGFFVPARQSRRAVKGCSGKEKAQPGRRSGAWRKNCD